MRSFSALIFFVVSSGSEQPSTSNIPLLEAVYGAAKETQTLLPWSERIPGFRSLNSVKRSDNSCVFPLDVVIVQDATASFADDYAIMRDTELKLMFEHLGRSHPGSRYGVVSFRDKPVEPLGRTTDYCQKIWLPLTNDTKAVEKVYAEMQSTGGGDFCENQLGAIFTAAASQELKWSSRASTSARLIVLATDAPPHYADDGLNIYGMLPFSGLYNATHPAEQCLSEYYPSPEHVKAALWARQAYLAQLVFDSLGSNGIVGRSWNWFNSFIGQTSDFVEPMLDDASNFWEALSSVIDRIEDVECAGVTSSTTTRPSSSSEGLTSSATPISTTTPPAATSTSPTPATTTREAATSTSTTPATTTREAATSTSTTPAATTREAATSTTSTRAVTTSGSEPITSTTGATTSSETETSPSQSGTTEEPSECPTTTSTECETTRPAECETTTCKEHDEVVIRLLHRPARLRLEIDNNVTSF